MPTIILLQTSLSLQKQITESENLVDVFQRNVLYFLVEMEEKHPLEMTSLITFSSQANLLCPYTRDFKSLKSSLYNIKLEEGNNFENALETTTNYASSNSHNFADVITKIIILTTCDNAQKWRDINFYFEFSSIVNIFIVGESEANLKLFNFIPTCAEGSIVEFRPITQTSLPKINEKLKFILFKYYSNYIGDLLFGNLETSFGLYPNPNESLYSNIAASQNDLPLWFPQSISVLGCIHSNVISSPPSLARFIMHPVKCENQGLLHLLFQSLSDNKVALVALSKKMWFGMIHQDCFIDSNNEKKFSLLLTVFPKNCSVEWLGNLKDLSTTSKYDLVLPLNSRNGLLYSETDTYDIHSDTLKNDLNLLSEYCADLPAKTPLLFQQVEKLRKKTVLYNISGLLENASSIIKAAQESPETPSTYKYNDHDCQFFLGNLLDQILQNQMHGNQKLIKIPPIMNKVVLRDRS